MDTTYDSQNIPARFGPITTRFPASDFSQVLRLSHRPDLLIRYLAQSNDLTLSETEDLLATLPSQVQASPEEGTLVAA